MGILKKLNQMIKSTAHGWRASLPGFKRLSTQAQELANVTTLEARAYTDHAIAAQKSSGLVTHEDLEKKALVAVLEAKAYADSAVGGVSISTNAMARALVELRDRVDALTEAKVGSAAPNSLNLASVDVQSGKRQPVRPQPDGSQLSGASLTDKVEALTEAGATLETLRQQVSQLRGVLDHLDGQIAKLRAGEPVPQNTDGSRAK